MNDSHIRHIVRFERAALLPHSVLSLCSGDTPRDRKLFLRRSQSDPFFLNLFLKHRVIFCFCSKFGNQSESEKDKGQAPVPARRARANTGFRLYFVRHNVKIIQKTRHPHLCRPSSFPKIGELSEQVRTFAKKQHKPEFSDKPVRESNNQKRERFRPDKRWISFLPHTSLMTAGHDNSRRYGCAETVLFDTDIVRCLPAA